VGGMRCDWAKLTVPGPVSLKPGLHRSSGPSREEARMPTFQLQTLEGEQLGQVEQARSRRRLARAERDPA
jgi:hypothetical protein